LRSVAYGGSRMPRAVLTKAMRAFPNLNFTNAYGLTETSSTIAVLTPEDHRAALERGSVAERRLASVGRLVPGVEAQIRNPDGSVLATGQVGELWVRGPQVSGEYVGLDSVLDPAGWFPTRDRGMIDDAGYLFIDGRADDTIIRGSENIAPAEIEEVILGHPAVADAAVVGVPDDEWGERIVAALVLLRGATATEHDMKEYVRGQLRTSRTPDQVIFMSDLPYTSTGKLARRELAERLAAAT
jgi:acyl-CoA synthetase (AMP-forming)/AMP-acid ligase II